MLNREDFLLHSATSSDIFTSKNAFSHFDTENDDFLRISKHQANILKLAKQYNIEVNSSNENNKFLF